MINVFLMVYYPFDDPKKSIGNSALKQHKVVVFSSMVSSFLLIGFYPLSQKSWLFTMCLAVLGEWVEETVNMIHLALSTLIWSLRHLFLNTLTALSHLL